MPLPYPGYSWSFTQHAIAYERKNLFGLLQAAQLVAGMDKPRQAANQFLADERILTRNVRAGRGPDAWRDYQQALTELGLTYSIRLVPVVTLTPMGDALLDGLVGYSEALTTQALRYQYPNGFKAQQLRGGISLIQRQAEGGVLIKPAILILRTLLGLVDLDPRHAYLSASEIQHYLVPIFDYRAQPPTGARIIEDRRRDARLIQNGRRRNIQDWMTFLRRTDLFAPHRNGIQLSEVAISDRGRVESLVDYHSCAESFWIAADDREETRIRWFDHFGSVAIMSQWVRLERDINVDYESRNYPRGRDEIEELTDFEPDQRGEIVFPGIGAGLRDINENDPERPRQGLGDFVPPDVAELAAMHAKTEKAKSLHSRMVKELSNSFRRRGAIVSEDPTSVDLLVRSNNLEGIIEVKTVMPRTLRNRVRLGIGQLFEYQYRRKLETGKPPHLVLAISSNLRRNDSLVEFLNQHVNVGLLTRTEYGGYERYPSGRDTILNLLR